jgi:hypothetical protein
MMLLSVTLTSDVTLLHSVLMMLLSVTLSSDVTVRSLSSDYVIVRYTQF